MKVSNLGDSGFLVLRYKNSDLKIVYKSDEQQHSFNAPYQLTRMPRGFSKKHKIKGYYADTPEDALTYDCNVEKGDIVILASDGLYDNLYTKDIVAVINRYINKELKSQKINSCSLKTKINKILEGFTKKDAENIAMKLSTKAWKKSLSSNFISPFAEKVNSALKNQSTKLIPEFNEWRGGKSDDISAVVGIIV